MRAFNVILDEAHGVFGKVDGTLLFLADDGTLTVLEPKRVASLTVLEEVALSKAVRIIDRLRDAAARLACTQAQEVA